MDLAPLVRAVEVLMSPLEWGSQDVWLAESVRLVRDVRGVPVWPAPATALGELEELLRLPGDEPGWLQAALDSRVRAPRQCLAARGGRPRRAPPRGVPALRPCRRPRDPSETAPVEPGTAEHPGAAAHLRASGPRATGRAARGGRTLQCGHRPAARLSAHTVRHYLERVLDRLGLHSRKALALHLIVSSGERPQPPDPR